MLLKFIFHQWKSRVRSENITEKRKSAIIVDMEKIFNRKLSYKYFQTKSPKRSRNREGKRFYQVEISLTFTQLTFFRWKRKFISEKKRDPILLLSRFQRFLIVETMNIREGDGKIPGFESSSAVIDYLCTKELDSKSLFSKEAKEISGRNVRKSAADFRCVWERSARRRGEKSERNNNEMNA